MSFMPRLFKIWLMIGSAAIGLVLLAVYFGVFNVAADVPHSALVFSAIELVRDRSIAVRAKDVQVPALDDPALLADGAQHYAAMCADCHLAPGVEQSELREGLYPQPPRLSERIGAGAAEEFWIIKHGIKMTAMPAWGKTHDDRSIWGIVAFLQKLPRLTPDQYRALVGVHDDSNHHHHHPGPADQSGDQPTGHRHHHEDAAPRQTAPSRTEDDADRSAGAAHPHADALRRGAWICLFG